MAPLDEKSSSYDRLLSDEEAQLIHKSSFEAPTHPGTNSSRSTLNRILSSFHRPLVQIDLTPSKLVLILLAVLLYHSPLPTPSSSLPSRSAPPSTPTPTLPFHVATHRLTSDIFPPPSPTNLFPSLFPSGPSLGYIGPTPTGAEAFLAATAVPGAYPYQSHAAGLVPPRLGGSKKEGEEKAMRKWGYLSPWYSVREGFGWGKGGKEDRVGGKGVVVEEVEERKKKDDESEEEVGGGGASVPEGCGVKQVHILHRHGARYPTYGNGNGFKLLSKLNSSDTWVAKGPLAFLNDWDYKLGGDILTPFGRQQMFNLGVSMRIRYGALLRNFTESNTIPVFRTETEDRMAKSAANFAAGFFGIPWEGQFQEVVGIEAEGFNNTLSPTKICKNHLKAYRSGWYTSQWKEKYLKKAVKRLNALVEGRAEKGQGGIEFGTDEVWAMQELCAYETVALGSSQFCQLFTAEEWDGFEYTTDLQFWYDNGPGSPLARPHGSGYVQEFLARLTGEKIKEHKFTTNSTLVDDERTFPLGQSIYVDATHDVVVLQILTALGILPIKQTGPLPYTHAPAHRSFRTSQIVPFGTNVQFQVLTCSSSSVSPGENLRVLLNDGVVDLKGIGRCEGGGEKKGMCKLDEWIKIQRERLEETDWRWACEGDWDVEEGDEWKTTEGLPPVEKEA